MPDGRILGFPWAGGRRAGARGDRVGLRRRPAPLDDAARLPAAMLHSNYPKPRDYPVHGIDVSKFQGDIDWNAVASSGVKFAWIKATEGGDRLDNRFQANWAGAKAAGVPHGAYHFVYWCRPPMEEMAYFEQNAPVEQDALPPVLDVEATPTSRTCHKHLTVEGATADMRVMLDEMERHYGKRPIIYTTVDFYEAILSGGAFMDYPIWVRSTKHHPAVKYGSRRLGVLAISVRRRRRRHQRRTSIATSFMARRSNGTPSCASRSLARARRQFRRLSLSNWLIQKLRPRRSPQRSRLSAAGRDRARAGRRRAGVLRVEPAAVARRPARPRGSPDLFSAADCGNSPRP